MGSSLSITRAKPMGEGEIQSAMIDLSAAKKFLPFLAKILGVIVPHGKKRIIELRTDKQYSTSRYQEANQLSHPNHLLVDYALHLARQTNTHASPNVPSRPFGNRRSTHASPSDSLLRSYHPFLLGILGLAVARQIVLNRAHISCCGIVVPERKRGELLKFRM